MRIFQKEFGRCRSKIAQYCDNNFPMSSKKVANFFPFSRFWGYLTEIYLFIVVVSLFLYDHSRRGNLSISRCGEKNGREEGRKKKKKRALCFLRELWQSTTASVVSLFLCSTHANERETQETYCGFLIFFFNLFFFLKNEAIREFPTFLPIAFSF